MFVFLIQTTPFVLAFVVIEIVPRSSRDLKWWINS